MTRPAATSPAGMAPLVSEKAFAATVVALAHAMGWSTYRTWLSIRSTPGFPDMIAVRDGRLLAIEFKREGGKLTPAQERWIDLLTPCAETYVFRPSDWDKIVEVLSR